MRTRRPRSLIRQDGYDLAFCHLRFRKALSRYIDKRRDEGTRITQTQLCQNLADHLHLSQDSIDNYRKGYNGPANIEVVKDMAGYLEVEWTELMKEVTPMADKKMMQMEEKIEKGAGKEADRRKKSVTLAECPATSVEIPASPAESSPAAETDNAAPLTEFEKESAWLADYSVVLDLNDTSSDPVIRTYNYCWKVLHRNMLDIPDQTYEKLKELIKELGYWVYGLPVEPFDEGIVAVDPELRMDYFANLFVLDLSDEMEVEKSEWAERVTAWLVDDFYDETRKILKNFIPREPEAGIGRPQRNPKTEE